MSVLVVVMLLVYVVVAQQQGVESAQHGVTLAKSLADILLKLDSNICASTLNENQAFSTLIVEDIKDLRKQIHDLDDEKQELATDQKASNAEIGELKETMQSLNSTIESVTVTLQTMTATVETLRQQNTALQQQLAVDKMKVYFDAGRTSSLNKLGAYITYHYTNVKTNADINIHTGLFTCTIPGDYLFLFSAQTASGSDTCFDFYKNHVKVSRIHDNAGAPSGKTSRVAMTLILSMTKGDTFGVKLDHAGGLYDESDKRTHFIGIKL